MICLECLQKISEIYIIQNQRYQLVELGATDVRTDGHTKHSKLFGASVPTSQECLQKVLERYLIRNRRYLYIGLSSVRKWPTNRLTDRQKKCNYFEIVEKYPRNVSIKFQKDISSRTGVIPVLA